MRSERALLMTAIALTGTVASAAVDRSSGGPGCCTLIFWGLLIYIYRSGGADWVRSIGAAIVPAIGGWFIWRDRELGPGARWVALISAVLQLVGMLLGIIAVLVLGGMVKQFLPHTYSIGERAELYRDGFVRRCRAAQSVEVCTCVADRATPRDEQDRKQLAFGLQKGALQKWLEENLAQCGSANPQAHATMVEDDSLGLHPVSTVTSDPAGAKVFVNGKEKGVTPLDVKLTAGQRNEVKVELAGYFTETAEREPNAKEHFDLRFMLKAAARLDVKSTPPGAKVFVELKEALASTPGLTGPLDPGEVHVVVALPGYQAQAQTVNLDKGDVPVEVTLEPGVKLAVTSVPAEAEVSVDGAVLGRTPLDVYLPPKGKHTVEVSKETWSSVKRVFTNPKPGAFEARLTDVGLIAAQREVARARVAYDKANDALEKIQAKLERARSIQVPALEKQRKPLDDAMSRAAERLEKAESSLRQAMDERGIKEPPSKKEDD